MSFPTRRISIGSVDVGNDLPIVLIAGPCQIESLEHTLMIAANLVSVCEKQSIKLIFKASFDKANRTSIAGRRGIGLEEGLRVLQRVKKEFGCPVLTDVHEKYHCDIVSEVVDVIQIPAFLCRQTDLIIEAGKTGRAINVKKGQFLAPWDMRNVVEKLDSVGNENVLLTERGVSFGYNTLVSDMRSLVQMRTTGCPVVFDATHSVQQPGGLGGSSGGDRHFVPVLARAAAAVGVAALFIETHDDPDNAPSDGPNMVQIDEMSKLLNTVCEIDTISKRDLLFDTKFS
ncbi:MAG: 3-deoxy-8-phosphooctulonate synthase [Thalassobaculaceae bacterium]